LISPLRYADAARILPLILFRLIDDYAADCQVLMPLLSPNISSRRFAIDSDIAAADIDYADYCLDEPLSPAASCLFTQLSLPHRCQLYHTPLPPLSIRHYAIIAIRPRHCR